jgi:GNAT superfamily N-acetyltransferase
MAPGEGTAEERLRAHGLEIPDGLRLVSLEERPDLIDPSDHFNGSVWPAYMLESEIANGLFGRCFRDWPQLQFALLDAADGIVATNNAMPLAWDGTDEGLPAGWEDQVIRSVADHHAGRPLDTLGAMQIVVDPAVQGAGLSGTMVGVMRAAARAAGYRAVIACVRPTWKDRYPLIPIEQYAFWRRDDGLPFDPWIRLHARLGGRIIRGVPESMTMRASVADWERWTGMDLPETGSYLLARATSPLRIDRERDEGVYHDENVWMVHELD